MAQDIGISALLKDLSEIEKSTALTRQDSLAGGGLLGDDDIGDENADEMMELL